MMNFVIVKRRGQGEYLFSPDPYLNIVSVTVLLPDRHFGEEHISGNISIHTGEF